jgi:hypothetical protein
MPTGIETGPGGGGTGLDGMPEATVDRGIPRFPGPWAITSGIKSGTVGQHR